jgi:lactoylglutathione lyase
VPVRQFGYRDGGRRQELPDLLDSTFEMLLKGDQIWQAASMTESKWTPAVGAITLVVADLEASKSFYSSAFTAPLIFENEDSAVFRFGPTVINLLHRSSADELLAPSPVGSVGDAPRAVFTVQVPDTDRYCVELAERGITLLNGPMNRPWGPRTASVVDPDGHVWEIAS